MGPDLQTSRRVRRGLGPKVPRGSAGESSRRRNCHHDHPMGGRTPITHRLGGTILGNPTMPGSTVRNRPGVADETVSLTGARSGPTWYGEGRDFRH